MQIKTLFVGGLLALSGVAASAAVTGLPDFTQLVEKEGKAVVNVSTTATLRDSGDESGLDEDTLNLLRRFGFPVPPSAGQQQPRERTAQSLGSGFVIDANGYILTNAHVVAQADSIKVTLTDKKEYKATVVGSDTRTDIALLKIEATNLPKVDLGNSDVLKPGQWVVAIGSPFGFENTVTAGIVSATGRRLLDENQTPFIQTDVAINPGNSGGPLFNLDGQVVGINSQIYSRSGGFMGLSFSIPINEAMKVVAELKAHGKVIRGRIGVAVQSVSDDLAKSFGLTKAQGALVSAVDKDGPAGKAGVKPGDIVLKFNGQPVEESSDLPRLVTSTKPGTTATMQIWRDKSARDVTLTVATLDEQDEAAPGKPGKPGGKKNDDAVSSRRFGLSLVELNPRQLKQLGIKYGVGVQGASGAAMRAGLQQGDVIIGIAGAELTSFAQLKQALDALKPAETLALRVMRQDGSLFLTIKAPEKTDKDKQAP
ncbi:DegQ family serine endoprotease [Silvimonas amylolytica]|uniref:Probable periplasmic serine endoprotease DegP-like n=1 Tax=Silvimonas amylolytica TaxID=449663 RepID=A0ABQ2PP41_9NEIS|nr:DegQ family serine endoprotease [Silvimonas amylolytica]GGP27395.1 peptidase [Silvimonas amylolytica]